MKSYESVKLEKSVVNKVREVAAVSKQTISGYITLATEEKLSNGIFGKIKNDPELFEAWKSNIAMSVKDEFARWKKKKKVISYADMHQIANNAAKEFLTLLTK